MNSYKIIILPSAKQDIIETMVWYTGKQKGLGVKFVAFIKKEFKKIQKNPLLYTIRYDDTRIAVTDTFPYLIHFNVYDNIILLKLFSTHPETLKYGKKEKYKTY